MTEAKGGDGDEGGGAPPLIVGRPARALAWSFGNTAASKLGTLVIGVALARILGPEEFGTYAVAFVALLAVLAFNELGVSLAIVRWPEDPREIAPTVNTISLAGSATITALLMLAAPAFTTAMGAPEATGLVRLLALCVLLNGVVATPAAVLQRYFRQDRRTLADQVNVWLGAGVSLGLAASGLGAVSLAIGRVTGAGVSSAILFRSSPIPYRLGLDRRYVRPLLRFGLPLAGASSVVFAVGFVDQLMVGALMGPTLLGYYVLAFNLANWPVAVVSQPLRAVAPAVFARMQHDPVAMQQAFNRVLRPLASVALPGCLVLSIVAEPIVRLVYGEAWVPAAAALRWLALLAALRIFFELAYDYLVVLGRSQQILWTQILWLFALVPALAVGLDIGGVAGAGVALLSVAGLVVLPMYVLLLRRVGIRTEGLVRAVATPVAAATALAVIAWFLVNGGATSLVALLSSGVLTAVVLVGLLALFRGDLQVWRDPLVLEAGR